MGDVNKYKTFIFLKRREIPEKIFLTLFCFNNYLYTDKYEIKYNLNVYHKNKQLLIIRVFNLNNDIVILY